MGAIAVLAAALASPVADAQGFAAQWMMRVTQAARTLNYSGTILVRQGARFDTFRLAHMFDNEQESEKLLSLDGPAREIVRSATEVRYYFPDAKVVRIEPRTIRNVFPSLSPEQTAKPRAVLRVQAHPRRDASRAASPRWRRSSRATACATRIASGPMRRRASCCARASSTRRAMSSRNSPSPM
jgi:hypothetical protein